MKELTDGQIERQDFVNDTIMECIRELARSRADVSWDIEMIRDIRDRIQGWIVKDFSLMTEQEFYPYLVPDKTVITIRGGCIVSVNSEYIDQDIFIQDYDILDENDRLKECIFPLGILK